MEDYLEDMIRDLLGHPINAKLMKEQPFTIDTTLRAEKYILKNLTRYRRQYERDGLVQSIYHRLRLEHVCYHLNRENADLKRMLYAAERALAEMKDVVPSLASPDAPQPALAPSPAAAPEPAEVETEQQEPAPPALSEEEKKEQEIVSKLKSVFKTPELAEKFYQDNKDKDPGNILEEAAKAVVNGGLYENRCRSHIYNILKGYGLYDKSQSNWNMQIKKVMEELKEKKKRNEPL